MKEINHPQSIDMQYYLESSTFRKHQVPLLGGRENGIQYGVKPILENIKMVTEKLRLVIRYAEL